MPDMYCVLEDAARHCALNLLHHPIEANRLDADIIEAFKVGFQACLQRCWAHTRLLTSIRIVWLIFFFFGNDG